MIGSFHVHFCVSFLENHARQKEKNNLPYHHIISMACTLIKHSSRLISLQEISQLWQELGFCHGEIHCRIMFKAK